MSARKSASHQWGVLAFAITVYVPVWILHGWVTTKIWAWIVTPVWSIPAPSLLAAMGLVLIASHFIAARNYESKQHTFLDVLTAATTRSIMCLMTLGFGYVIGLLIGGAA